MLIASELWSAQFLMPPLIILLFPDGMLPPRWQMVCRAYLAVCALIIGILLGGGAWQMTGTRIVVTSKGQLVNNSGPAGALGFVLVIGFLAVPVFWGFVRGPPGAQLAAGHRGAPGPAQVAHGGQCRQRHRAGRGSCFSRGC